MNHPLVAVRHGARRAPVTQNSKLKTQNSNLTSYSFSSTATLSRFQISSAYWVMARSEEK